MIPAPVPSRRFTFPCPHFGNRQSSFGHSRNGSSRIDWNASKFCSHFLHEYSYVGMRDLRRRSKLCMKQFAIQALRPHSLSNDEIQMTNDELSPNDET